MPNQGYPEDSPTFPGRETAEPTIKRQLQLDKPLLQYKSPVQYVVHGYSNQPAVYQTTVERVAATRKIEVAEVSPSVADGILKNAAGSTETGKFPIRSGILRLQHWITEWAIGKGWLVPGQPRELLHQLMLVVSELSEACEAHREGNPKCTRPNMGEFSHVEEELADAVIRILQIAGEHNFRIADAIIAKMEFNETRPVKHGKLC